MWLLEKGFSTLKYNFITSVKISNNSKAVIKQQCLTKKMWVIKNLRRK